MMGIKQVDEVESEQTMTVNDILNKAEWLKYQAEKNRELLKGDGHTEVIPKEGLKFACLAHEYMDRIDECVAEYERLAADYVMFKQKVMSLWKQMESWFHATCPVINGVNVHKEVEGQ